MIGNRCLLTLMPVLALILCSPQSGDAQTTPQNNQTYGTFGYRTLGQSFVPRPGSFGGGIQTSPNGSFLSIGRSGGPTPFVAQSALNTVPSPQSLAPAFNAPEFTANPDFADLFFPGTNEVEGPAEQVPVIGPPLASAGSVARSVTGAASATPRDLRPATRSPELSERLTRLARSKGILSGPSITVYLSNNIARLEGTVHTSHDRALLASILGLEPVVRQIDNRLIVDESGILHAE